MLETFNDYISLIVLVIITFQSLRIFVESLFGFDNKGQKKKVSALFDYYDFKD